MRPVVTVAVCVKCGSIKHGAFNHCSACGMRPETEADLTYSLALTDHYFSADVLNQISVAMLSGKPRPSLPPDQEEKLRDAARMYVEKFGAALGLPPLGPTPRSAPPYESTLHPNKQLGIRIHAAGQGRSTHLDLVSRLEKTTPRSCSKAQDVLVATEKYVVGPGFFRSRRSLIQRLQSEIYELKDALSEEDYKAELKDSPVELIFSYLSEFSDAFPNWQHEYAALNSFVPLCF